MSAIKTHNVANIDIDGTYLQGYINCTYDRLVARFGNPMREGDDEEGNEYTKVRAEWNLQFEDGTIATVYDWKTFGPIKGVRQWNVGGHTKTAVTRVNEALR